MSKRTHSMIIGSALLAVCLSTAATPAAAASTPGCLKVHGTLEAVVSTFDSGTGFSGTITKGGVLNGTTADVFTLESGEVVFTYNATFGDSTRNGVLQTDDSGAILPGGILSESGTVDPAASTGGFAGARGSLSFSGSTTDYVHFTASVSGLICGTNL